MINNKGPRTSVHSEDWPFKTTRCNLFVKKSDIHFKTLPDTLKFFKFQQKAFMWDAIERLWKVQKYCVYRNVRINTLRPGVKYSQ